MSRNYIFSIIVFALLLLSLPNMVLAGWVKACNGQIPRGAHPEGYEASGEPLWIARVNIIHQGRSVGTHIGKMRPGFGGGNIPWGGREIFAKCYDVWVGPAHWVPAEYGNIPRCALPSGEETDGTYLFVARARFKGGVHIGKVRPEFGGANIGYGGKEYTVPRYEVMCR